MTTEVELPTGWSRLSLEDVAEIHDNLREPVNSSERSKRHGPYPYYGATGQVGWIDDYRQDGEYILLGEDGAPFFDWSKEKAYLVSGKCWVNNHAHVLKGRDGLCSNRYLLYALNQTDYRGYANGTTRLKLTQSAMKQIPINLAPPAEQHRIVAKIEELFSELDKGIENLKAAREQLRVYRQALLKHAFEGKLTAQWRAANPDKLEPAAALLARIQTEREQRYRQQLQQWQATGGNKPKAPKPLPPLTAEELAELPELPEGWGWFKVAHICDVVRGGSPRPAGDPKFYGGSIPFLKVADITTTSTPYLNTYTYTITEAGLSKTRQIEPNTLLLSNSGATLGVPKICLIAATMNDGVAAFLGVSHEVLLYHYYFWQSKTKELRNIDQGAAQPNLNTDLIKETFIPICSQAEQIAVAQRLEEVLSEVEQLDQTLTTSLQQSEALRQSILKRAFSGQLVAQDANDEPASELLERIRAERAAGEKNPVVRRSREKV